MSTKNSQSKMYFWDRKILTWEFKRYVQAKCGSLMSRRQVFLDQVKTLVEGKSVLEIGCGSAHLANTLFEYGANHYYGYDFSEVAIKNAWKCIDPKYHSKVSLSAIDINLEETLPRADLLFSLGLIDWLSEDEIKQLSLKSVDIPLIIHSFSEKTFDIKLLGHRLFVFLSYGFRNGLYMPKYYTFENLKKQFIGRDLRLIKEKEMGIGAMVKNW